VTVETIRFIDRIDARYADKCIIKPICFEKLVLIQSDQNENDLAGIITLN
jgi:BarA-like signal transduction histidine kinase